MYSDLQLILCGKKEVKTDSLEFPGLQRTLWSAKRNRIIGKMTGLTELLIKQVICLKMHFSVTKGKKKT